MPTHRAPGRSFAPLPPVELPKPRLLPGTTEAMPAAEDVELGQSRARSQAWLPLSLAGAVALGALAHSMHMDGDASRSSAGQPDASEMRLMSLEVGWRAIPPTEPESSDRRTPAPARHGPAINGTATAAGPAIAARDQPAAETAAPAVGGTASEPRSVPASPHASAVGGPTPPITAPSLAAAAGEPHVVTRSPTPEAREAAPPARAPAPLPEFTPTIAVAPTSAEPSSLSAAGVAAARSAEPAPATDEASSAHLEAPAESLRRATAGLPSAAVAPSRQPYDVLQQKRTSSQQRSKARAAKLARARSRAVRSASRLARQAKANEAARKKAAAAAAPALIDALARYAP